MGRFKDRVFKHTLGRRFFVNVHWPFSLEVKNKSIGLPTRLRPTNRLTPVVRRVDSTIQWINHYPVDTSIGFASVYLLDGDLSER